MNSAPQNGKLRWITGYREAAAVLAHKAFAEVTFKGLVPLVGNVIVTVEGEAHRQRRSLEGRLFVFNLLKSHEEALIPSAINVSLEHIVKTGRGDLVQFSRTLNCRIAAQIIGLDGLENPAEADNAAFLLSALVGGSSVSHEGNKPLTRRQARALLKQRYLDRSVEKRRQMLQAYKAGKVERSNLPFDLITLMLQNGNWSVPQVGAEAAFYAVAAVDTTATLIPHLMDELWNYFSLNPSCINLARDPLFLRAASAEALRLHPVLPTLFRQAKLEVVVEGQKYKEGEVAGIYLSETNRDAEIFGQNAESFDPFRNLPPRIRRAGLSFGGGAHLCLGRELALGTPEKQSSTGVLYSGEKQESNLFGTAALAAEALLKNQARPDPLRPVHRPSPFQRDIFENYPFLIDSH